MLLSNTILPSLVVIVKQCGYMDTIVKKMLTGGQKLDSSFMIDFDGELVVERNYRKTQFVLRIYKNNMQE